MAEIQPKSMINKGKIENYTHFLILPLKVVGCWDWYEKPQTEAQIILNYTYTAMVLFVLLNLPISLMVNLYTEWTDIMACLDKIADGLPLLASLAIVAYFAMNKNKMYELIKFMNVNFKFHSARGLTNMTMEHSYIRAKNFAYFYTVCTMFSITMYVFMPVIIHCKYNSFYDISEPTICPIRFGLNNPYNPGSTPFFVITFLRQYLAQAFVGLAVGQLGIFFASNSILLCGQLDILCCSLRNVRYNAMLMKGVHYSALKTAYADIVEDEKHNYIYNASELKDSAYHFDRKVNNRLQERRTQYDIYSNEFDPATATALRECALVGQVVNTYKEKFEEFVSPLLALRVVQVTLYLCTLLYAATLKLDMLTVEYLVAVALDIFVYCYYGSQIILQAGRVSTAAYQSAWETMGVRPRRMLLNILVSNRRPIIVRAGWFLPMDLHTFVVIIKTSFSYYTLLVNLNDK